MLLLTNDDGIDAPGLEALRQAASGYGKTIVVAPDRQHSGSGHRVSDAESIPIEAQSTDRYAIGGTPADCTRVGLSHLAPDAEWVLSGINSGGNLGCDVFMSGTVAAVREAALMGTRAIAFSQYRKSMQVEFDWSRATRWAKLVLEKLLHEPLDAGEFWNVNFPDSSTQADPPEIVFCPVDVQHYQIEYEVGADGVQYRFDYHNRPRTPGRDIDVCFSGEISISKLTVCSNAPGMNQ
jgi:5'-nucleotidase